jgi:integrase
MASTEDADMTDRTQPRKKRTPRERPDRQRPGEGAIIQRSDGRWVGRLKTSSGTKWFSGKDGFEVKAKLDAARALDDAGEPIPDSKLTVGAWVREWLDGLRGGNLRASTIGYYTNYCDAYVLRSDLAEKPLAKLQAADLEHLYRRMTADKSEGGLGLSGTTARHMHAILHRALAKATRLGKVARNVAELVDPDNRPKVLHHEMMVLADADFDRFLEVIRGDRLEALFVVAIREGLRQGEILGLRWRDIDLDRGTIMVSGSLQGSIIGEPKTRKSRRSVTLFPETVTALREHRPRQFQERQRVGSMWMDGDLVFCNEFGGFLSLQKVRDVFHAILRKAGLPDVRFHDLRHSAATDWLKADMHPKIASERLGHASVAITLDLYSHVTQKMQREAVAAITRKRSAKKQDA